MIKLRIFQNHFLQSFSKKSRHKLQVNQMKINFLFIISILYFASAIIFSQEVEEGTPLLTSGISLEDGIGGVTVTDEYISQEKYSGTLPFSVLTGFNQQADSLEEEKQKIAQVISTVIGWAKDKNLELFYDSIAQDEDYISVTPGMRIVKCFEDVKQNVPFWMSPEFKYVCHELRDLEIKFARCGEVAWFFCYLDDINEWKGQPANWENVRWTGVLEKRDGRWRIVQQHFSWASE